MEERRRTPRLESTVLMTCLDGNPPLFVQDLSLGGVFATTHRVRWPGTLVRVRFRLPLQTRGLHATLRVQRLVGVPTGVGLVLGFVQPSTSLRLALHEAIDRRPRGAGDAGAPISAHVGAWVQRIVEDCDQLRALAQVS